MNKTKIRKLRHNNRLKQVAHEKEQKEIQEKKAFLVMRKKQYKLETKERSAKFFDEWSSKWKEQRSQENLAVPSLITAEWGKCTKKKSPLDDY